MSDRLLSILKKSRRISQILLRKPLAHRLRDALIVSRMLKKAVQQGRNERRGKEVHTALRVGRSPVGWILANGKAPTVLPTAEKALLNVEPLREVRTPLADFFSILLEARIGP
jgi:hypothetical protein